MKKLLTLTTVALAVSVTPVLADNHAGGGEGKHAGMFAKHDTNGDGVISKSEFLAHAEERFAKMDKDGNGEVSKDEARSAREAMHEKMKEKRQERKEKREERQEKRDSASE